MSETYTHSQFREEIEAYLAGGLVHSERDRFEAHMTECSPCRALFEEAVAADRLVSSLFADASPAPGFEDRVVRRLREARPGRSLRLNPFAGHAAVRRAVGGIAAALVLGAMGYVGSTVIEEGRVPSPVALLGGHVTREATLGESNQSARGTQDFDDDALEDLQVQERRGRESARAQAPAASPAQVARQLNRGHVTSFFETAAGANVSRWDYIAPAAERKPDADAKVVAEGDKSGRVEGEAGGVVAGQAAQELAYRFLKDGTATKLNTLADADGTAADRFGAVATSGGAVKLNLDAGEPADAPQAGAKIVTGYAVVPGEELSKSLKAQAGDAGGVADLYFKPAAIEADSTRETSLGLLAGKPAAPEAEVLRRSEAKGTAVQELAQQVQAVAREVEERESALEAERVRSATANRGDGSEPSESASRGFGGSGGGGIGGRIAGGTSGGAQGVPGLRTAERPLIAQANTQASPAQAEPSSAAVPENPPPSSQQAQASQQNVPLNRKIIRNGEVEFEVEGFDSSVATVTKIVVEENGFVSSTDSEKLPNGKVRGTVVVRVPPDRLDTFILKLRALGDLRSQKISAQDVTKQYTDLESELKAGRAMEQRLLEIIKSGKGEIKDLLEAEKQLGVYRKQIEKLEGEIRYYNNLVSLSTLSITLTEKDIRTPAVAAQTETVSMGIETEGVEKARLDAIKAIDEAKGRVIESNLKQHDAGQLAATIVCDVPPDAGGSLIDRLRQLGRVARLDVDRKQQTRDGSGTPQSTATNAPTRVERRDTRFSISIYNLANIAPRQTTNLNLAVPDVEEAYRSILASVSDRGGRVVTSTLNRQKPEQTTGTLNFELPAADAEAALAEIRRDREVMGLTVTENPDTQNVTAAKRGFAVQIYSLAVVPPRETEQLVLTAKANVAETFRTLVEALRKSEARILVSQLNEQEGAEVAGTLEFEVLRTRELDVRTALAAGTDTIARTVARSSDVANTVDSKVRMNLRLLSLDKVPARETQSISAAVGDVPAAFQAVVSALNESSARVITSRLNQDDQRRVTGVLDFEVSRDRLEKVEKALSAAGALYARSVTRAPETQNSVESKVRLMVTLNNVSQLPPRERTRLMMEVTDVEARAGEVLSASDAAGGRTIEQTHSKSTDGQTTSHLVIEVPLAKAVELRRQIREMGTVRVSESSTNPQAPEGQVARAQLDITLATPELLVGRDAGLAASLRNALATSLKGLLFSLQFIVVGLLFVGPWALLLYLAWKMIRRGKGKATVGPAPA